MDDTYPSRCAAQDNPGANWHFNRRWGTEGATGRDVPENPAHAATWQAEDEPLPIAGSNHRNRVRRAAERAFAGGRDGGYRRGSGLAALRLTGRVFLEVQQ